MWALLGPQPFDKNIKITQRHRGASGGHAIGASSGVKEDGTSSSGLRGIGIMPNLQHVFVGGITKTHALLLKPWRHIARIGDEVLVVIWVLGIIDPGIPFRDLAIGIIPTLGHRLGIPVELADGETPSRGAAIALTFVGGF